MKYGFLTIAAIASFANGSALWAQSDLMARYSHWEQRLRERVNEELSYPAAANGAAGDVLIGFRVGADGKPTEVTVRHSSGNPIFDQAAVRLVSHLGRLGPIPTADPQVGDIVLKLSYGDPSSTAVQSMQLGMADHREQLANERRDRAIISHSTRVAQSH
jgi:TonB family protein